MSRFHAEGGLAGFPSKIQIQTINRCNYACPMCPYPEVTAQEGRVQLDGDLFRRLIEEVREAGRQVKLCLMLQNEPFLDRRFVDFLGYAHRAEDAVSSISTVSNGSVLSEELLDTLMRFDRFYLTLSVNSTDRERYYKVHGRDLWERIHTLLTGWGGRRERIRLSFVLSGDAVEEGRAFQRYWQGLGYATRMMPIFARVDTMTVDSPVHGIDAAYGHCHYPVDTLTTLADGSVILCCNDWLHGERFGNLYHSSISEVWNGPELARLRDAAIRGSLREHPMCSRCDYPIRSSQRVRLEVLLAGSAAWPSPAVLPHAVHEAAIRIGLGAPPLPVLVWNLDREAGVIEAFAAQSLASLPEPAWFEMRIGHCGAFNFGSLEPVWCPARVLPKSLDIGVAGAAPLRIELDRQSAEFRFFPWYCADWATAAEPGSV